MSEARQSTQFCESAETKGHKGPGLFQLSGCLSRCLSEVQLHRLRDTDWWMMAIHWRRHHPRNARHVVKDKPNMNLKAMVWKICFEEQEINIEGGKDPNLREKEGQLQSGIRLSTNVYRGNASVKTIQLHFAIEKPFIFVLYFAFDSMHNARHHVVGTSWFILVAWQIRFMEGYNVISTMI